jgi:hypothetical protein
MGHEEMIQKPEQLQIIESFVTSNDVFGTSNWIWKESLSCLPTTDLCSAASETSWLHHCVGYLF